MNVAFIPVRGGSKSIPLKNIKPICGHPLVYWTVKAAASSEYIDKVYVSTDSDLIRQTVESFCLPKVTVISRSEAVSTDTASTESTMLEFAEKYEFDNIALIQATSPLLRVEDIDNGFIEFSRPGVDSVLSTVRQKRFNWRITDNGLVEPTNYNVFKRPRRQEFDGYLVENGAFYVCSREDLLRTKNRLSGNIGHIEMDEDTFFEIDEPSDWLIIEALMKKKGLDKAPESHNHPIIKMFLTDCDGCLTDAGMYYSEAGDELKKFNTRDGMGFKLLREAGIITGIITSENVALVKRRAEKLKLDILEMGATDKVAVIKRLCEEKGIAPENVAYVGDDINDVDAIKFVGFGCSVNSAIPEAKAAAKYVSKANGGEGAIREIIEQLIAR